LFKQAEALFEKEDYPTRFITYDILAGWCYAHMGQTDKLAPWIKSDFEESDLNSIVFGLEILVKAKYHFAEKRCPAALAVLETWGTRNSLWDFVLGRIEKKVLEAVCYYQLRDKEAAYTALKTAYALALPNAISMPVTELGKDMRTLAEAALKDNAPGLSRNWLERVHLDAASYAKKFFAVTEHYRSASPRHGDGQGLNLSHREQEVLTSLSQGMTQEEIASQSSLSVNTVKSIIRSIYGKLGAVNKADAVRIAVSRGLV
jgi:LuxR family maltose regulon positive regulatory protein